MRCPFYKEGMVNLTVQTVPPLPKLIVNKLHLPFAGLSTYHIQGPVLDAGRDTTVTRRHDKPISHLTNLPSERWQQ